MSLTFLINQNPYNLGLPLTQTTDITVNDGLTILVGCNGTGKSTLLENINIECKKQNIPCYKFSIQDNVKLSSLIEGSYVPFECNNLGLAFNIDYFSEGENMNMS